MMIQCCTFKLVSVPFTLKNLLVNNEVYQGLNLVSHIILTLANQSFCYPLNPSSRRETIATNFKVSGFTGLLIGTRPSALQADTLPTEVHTCMRAGEKILMSGQTIGLVHGEKI